MSEIDEHFYDAMDDLFFNDHDAALRAKNSVYRETRDTKLYDLVTEIMQTDKAYLVVFVMDGKTIERWLPKSQSAIPFADKVEITDWLAKRIREEIKNAPVG